MKSETIINRMIDELAKARKHQNNTKQMNRHIENVQLLCDVMLANDREVAEVPSANTQHPSTLSDQVSEQEIKAMLGGQQVKSNRRKTESLDVSSEGNANIYHGGGDSLFDF